MLSALPLFVHRRARLPVVVALFVLILMLSLARSTIASPEAQPLASDTTTYAAIPFEYNATFTLLVSDPSFPWPFGEVTLGGIPFSIPASGLNMWKADSQLVTDPWPYPRTLDIPVNQSRVDTVYTLITTGGGIPNESGLAWIEFFGSDGAHYRKDLVGDVDMRDFNRDGWTNAINGTTTVNVFSHGGGQTRMDMQIIDLPAEFLNQTLTAIVLTDNGNGRPQAAFLQGLTVALSTDTAGPVLYPANGHYYEVVTTPLTWDAAKANAEARTFLAMAGHLATVTSAAEQQFIESSFASADGPWLGGFQPAGSPEPGGNWQWVTGESFAFTDWASGEPNNDQGNYEGQENALMLRQDGLWNDQNSGSTHPFIVEYEPSVLPAQANLVINGSFEEPVVPGGNISIFYAGSSIPGWTIQAGSIDLISPQFWQPAADNQSVDLTGNCSSGVIYQDLPTVEAQTYRLGFSLAGNPGGTPAVKEMEIWWGAALVDTVTFDITGHTYTSMGWREHYYTLQASTATTRLTFRSLTGGCQGPALDAVSVRANVESPAPLITTDSSLPSGTVGQPYTSVLAATGGMPPYTWAIGDGTLPLGLSLDPATGALAGIPTAAATWRFTVLLADAQNQVTSKEFVLATQSNTPPPAGLTIVTDSALPGGTVGQFYAVLLEATGGVQPYAWLLLGALPPGLELDGITGEIRGVPTTAGTYAFTIQVTDSSGVIVEKHFAFTPPPPSGSSGSSYSAPIVINPSPDPGSPGAPACSNYTVVSGSLPDGLTLDPTTGSVSGTPTVPGSYSFIVRCVTGTGQTATKGFTITIGGANQPPTALPGGPYSVEEGSTLALNGSGSDPDGDSLSYVWDLNHDGVFETPGQTPTFFAVGRDGPSAQAIVLRVCDTHDACAPATAEVVVTNAVPTISAVSNNGPIDEGGTVQVSVTAADAAGDLDPLSYSIDCNGDGSADLPAQAEPVAECSFAQSGSFPVNVRVEDGDGGEASGSTTVVVNNVAPTVNAGEDQTRFRNEPVSLAGSWNDPAGAGDAPYAWNWNLDGDGTPDQNGSSEYGAAIAAGTAFATEGSYTLVFAVADKEGAAGSDSLVVTVLNRAPELNVTQPALTVQEGQTAGNSGTLVDADGDAVSLSASFGTVTNLGDGTWSWSATPDDGPAQSQTVTISADDGHGDQSAVTFELTVENVLPTASLGQDGPVVEGSAFSLSLTDAADPSQADTAAGFTYAFDCGDGQGIGAFGAEAGVACPTSDNGTRTVKAQMRDKDDGVSEYSAAVEVQNAPPSVGPISVLPSNLAAVNSALSFSAGFADAGVLDTHTAAWDWGDGSISAGTVTEANGAGTVADSHIYAAAGAYTVQLSVTDKDGAVGSSLYQFVVVYDPSGGFVTGGGWIDSPPGAYPANPSLTGKANLSVNAQYKKGAKTPSGNTEFQFKAGNLNFRSTSYQWLVVAGAKAQYKGEGTINGSGSYGFLLTTVDGRLNGGGGTDKFRIKIWDKGAGDRVVYDNQMNAGEGVAPTTVLGGGSIVVHKGDKTAKGASVEGPGGETPVSEEEAAAADRVRLLLPVLRR